MYNHTSDKVQHISYDDIEKRLSLLDDIISDADLCFVERFDDQVNNCDVCGERFGDYIMISSLADEPQDFPMAPSDFLKAARKGIEKLVSILVPPTVLLDPRLDFALARKGGVDIKEQDDSGASITDVLLSEKFFNFTVELPKDVEKAGVRIKVKQEASSDAKYYLHLMNVATNEIVELEMTARDGTLDTDKYTPLEAGIYKGKIAEG